MRYSHDLAGRYEIRRLKSDDLKSLMSVMRDTWQKTYVDIGEVSEEILNQFTSTKRILREKKQIGLTNILNKKGQYDFRYLGAFAQLSSKSELLGFIKSCRSQENDITYNKVVSFFSKIVKKADSESTVPKLEFYNREIMELDVLPRFQGGGIGSCLMHEVVKTLSTGTEVNLSTPCWTDTYGQRKVPSEEFFKSAGFIIKHNELARYPDPDQGPLLAVKWISKREDILEALSERVIRYEVGI